MTCAEFKNSVHAFVLDALDADERRACEAHLASAGPHDGCRAELARAREVAALLAMSVAPVEPRPEVWRAIAAKIGAAEDRGEGEGRGARSRATAERASSAARDPGRRPGRAGRGRSWREAAAWTAAAAAVVALLFSANARRDALERLSAADRHAADETQNARDADQARQLCVRELESAHGEVAVQQAALSLIQDPRTQLVQLAAQGGAPFRASAILNPTERRAIVLASQLAAQPGKSYELWVIRGAAKIPAGLLPEGGGAPTVASIDPQILAAGAPDALAVTIEPAGGSAQPTGPIVLLGAVPKV